MRLCSLLAICLQERHQDIVPTVAQRQDLFVFLCRMYVDPQTNEASPLEAAITALYNRLVDDLATDRVKTEFANKFLSQISSRAHSLVQLLAFLMPIALSANDWQPEDSTADLMVGRGLEGRGGEAHRFIRILALSLLDRLVKQSQAVRLDISIANINSLLANQRVTKVKVTGSLEWLADVVDLSHYALPVGDDEFNEELKSFGEIHKLWASIDQRLKYTGSRGAHDSQGAVKDKIGKIRGLHDVLHPFARRQLNKQRLLTM